jgi:hypothetical protein
MLRVIAVVTALTCTLSVSTIPTASAASDELEIVRMYDLAPGAYTVGGDGNIWMSLQDGLRRLTVDGVTTDFPLPVGDGVSGSFPVTASDGSVWTLADDSHEVWRIDANDPTPSLELVVDFGSATANRLVPAGGARMWTGFYAAGDDSLVLMGAGGVIDDFDVASLGYFAPTTGGADGSLWFGNLNPFADGNNTTLTRIGTDGAASQVPLETSDAGGHPEDVTSMAFDGAGTLWYTTYSEEVVTVGGAHGGGVGRYNGGLSEWWPRPYAPPFGPDYGEPRPSGALPHAMQAGTDGWMYFAERSPRGNYNLARVDPSLRVQYVEFRSFGGAVVRNDLVWLFGDQAFGRGVLSRLFAEGTAGRRIFLRYRHKKAAFVGTVSSSNSGCERTILALYRREAGSDQRVRQGRSKINGTFRLKLRDAGEGRYYVKAKSNPLPGGVTTCGADKSPLRRVKRP